MGCAGSSLSNEELAKAAVNPPLPKGHAILESLFGALEAEYARNEGPKVGDWLEKLPEFGRGGEAELRPHGISVGEFESWVEKVEETIRQKATSLQWISQAWQVANAGAGPTRSVAQPMAMPPQVIAQPMVMQPEAVVMPMVMQPQAVAMPMAQPGMVMAQPGMVMAQPGMAMAQPGMVMTQPAMMAQPAMAMAQPVMAQPM
jgi:hypothetical protein